MNNNEYTDVWPPGTCIEAAMMAYKMAQDHGDIKIQKVEVGRSTGKAVMRYTSNMPRETILTLLQDYKNAWALAQKVRNGGEQQ